MAQPTLSELFGNGATQDLTQVVIPKSVLVAQGLTASADNSAESIIVALVKHWSSVLTDTYIGLDPDRQVKVEQGTDSITVRTNGDTYRSFPFTVTLYKAFSPNTIDPDDF